MDIFLVNGGTICVLMILIVRYSNHFIVSKIIGVIQLFDLVGSFIAP